MLLASNKSLAEYNLSQEPRIREARSKMQEKHREATRLAEKVRNLKAEIDSNSGKTDPDTLLALLKVKGSEVEDESEQIADDFMSKRIADVDGFLESFMVNNYHILSFKQWFWLISILVIPGTEETWSFEANQNWQDEGIVGPKG